MRYLLDKNIVRYILSALVYGHRRSLSDTETGALLFWRKVSGADVKLYISPMSGNILQRLPSSSEVQMFTRFTQLLVPTRYHTRWWRRVRETTGLSREDAGLVALATFGTDAHETFLGVQHFVTYDQHLINGFNEHLFALRRRLRAMIAQLRNPYNLANLPSLLTPDDVV